MIGEAGFIQRADAAAGRCFGADGSTQIHDALRVGTKVALRHLPLGEIPEDGLMGRPGKVPTDHKVSREKASYVTVGNDTVFLVAQGQYGASR